MSMSITSSSGRRLAWAVIYVCAASLVLGFVLLVVSIRTTQLEGTPVGKRLIESSDRILDCTNPEGECAKRNQAATAEAVGSINEVIVLAAACAVGLDPDLSVLKRQTLIQTCVIDGLSQKP